jgi:hypothetical protein
MELAKKFGDTNMEEVLELFDSSYRADIAAAETPEIAAKLRQDWHTDRTYIEGTRDALRHTIALPDDPTSFAGMSQRAAKQIRNYNVLRVAGGFSVVALADVGNLAIAVGAKRAFGDLFMPWISKSEDILKQMSKAELEEIGVFMDDALNFRAASIWDVTDMGHYNSWLEEAGSNLAHKFFSVNLLTPWTNMMKTIASQSVLSEFVRIAGKAARGTISPDELARLSRGHIPVDAAIEIFQQITREGGTGMINPKGKVLLGIESWNSPRAPELRRLLRNLIIEDVERAIVTPGVGDVPLFLKTHTGMLLGQFKSFGFSIGQKVVIPAIQGLAHGDTRILNAIPLSIAMGSTVYMVRELFNKRELDTDLDRVLQEGVVRSDLWAAVATMDDVGSAVTNGSVSIRGTLGPDTYHGYHGDSILSSVAKTVLGPTYSTFAELGKAGLGLTSYLADGKPLTSKEIRALRRIMPYQNLFYTDFLFDAVQNGVDSGQRQRDFEQKTIDAIGGY